MDMRSFGEILAVVCALAISAAACTAFSTPEPRHVIDMRAVDWEKFVENDPNLQHPVPRDQDWTGFQKVHGPYIKLEVDGYSYPLAGCVKQYDFDVSFIDLSGDGQEEAAILVNACGGSAGSTGVLIYGVKDSAPALIGVLVADHAWVQSEGNLLLFQVPIYADFDTNCCPSGEAKTYYRLVENRLVAVKHSYTYTLEPKARERTVQYFYNALRAKEYRIAYYNLSVAFQSANPYVEWVTQYQNTTSIIFKTSELPDGSIGADFTKTDLTASGEVTKHWFAEWTLVATPQGWRMDSVQLTELPW
jgi:hypothetical protein